MTSRTATVVSTSPVLAKEVARYNENFIKRNRALGELGHPDGPTVNLDRVSHNITELYQEGSNFIGKANPEHPYGGKIDIRSSG